MNRQATARRRVDQLGVFRGGGTVRTAVKAPRSSSASTPMAVGGRTWSRRRSTRVATRWSLAVGTSLVGRRRTVGRGTRRGRRSSPRARRTRTTRRRPRRGTVVVGGLVGSVRRRLKGRRRVSIRRRSSSVGRRRSSIRRGRSSVRGRRRTVGRLVGMTAVRGRRIGLERVSSVMRGRRRSSRAETSARGRPITSSGHRRSSSFAYTSRRLLIASDERLTKRALESQRSGARQDRQQES
jgi:hypothetical protein